MTTDEPIDILIWNDWQLCRWFELSNIKTHSLEAPPPFFHLTSVISNSDSIGKLNFPARKICSMYVRLS